MDGRPPPSIQRAEEIDVPVHILRGDRDQLATRDQMQRYQDALPDVQLIELADLSHCPQLDDPEQVAGHILTLLAP